MKDFKTFLLRGDVVELAIAVVIGIAFEAVITAFVRDLITPLISIPGKTNFAALHFTVNGSTFSTATSSTTSFRSPSSPP